MFQPVLVFADDASIARGGKLYDKWFKVILLVQRNLQTPTPPGRHQIPRKKAIQHTDASPVTDGT
ncbi:hypothetical protein BOV90_04820 [Solemya velum gill symbiont]|nr:hypothetical protein BOV88_07315 [Solemya velum gill symbiont]OOY37327.1 hypothetical protein BOV89_08010 [Solemya velum gill symbiont]OOY40307.1 hypothetical protein BOV90_04820 [Solemya velum gill symbiont]OOY44039.1 hypothetical protein BOV91_02445 [Solemya velum gill symbiont]OOY47278.1 hypothetical protein BOV93_07270 [Solemya velum gill symbiont]